MCHIQRAELRTREKIRLLCHIYGPQSSGLVVTMFDDYLEGSRFEHKISAVYLEQDTKILPVNWFT